MGKELNLYELIARAEAAKKEYDEVLASGMMFQWFPLLTGDYNRDENAWGATYELLLKIREIDGK